MIKVYQPRVEVTLIKLVARQDGVAARYSAAEREIDLTPYLGEGGVVRTAKTLDSPAGGFSIAFGDQMDRAAKDSLYALIEPMDMIEIRASREPHLYTGQKLPLIMRGFVSTVRRPETMAGDRPRRAVVVMGQDAGKLWLTHGVWLQVAVAEEKPLLEIFRMQAATGMDVAVFGLSDFVRTVTEQVMNPKVAKLAGVAQRAVPQFTVDATVPEGQVIPNMMSNYEGPLWGLLDAYAERPWNELFIEDTEDGPVVRFRPVPFKGIDGRLIMPGAADPGTIDLDIAAIVSLDLARSDTRVANFFWVPPGASMLDTDHLINVSSLTAGQPLDFHHGNNLPALYGTRKMIVETHVIPTDVPGLPTKLPSGSREAASQRYALWHQRRSEQLKAMNRDNSVLEEGTVVARGDEFFKPGRNLRITRGALTFEAYLTAVQHTIPPLGNWISTLSIERSTGFLERLKMDGSPYIGEGRPGAYGAALR